MELAAGLLFMLLSPLPASLPLPAPLPLPASDLDLFFSPPSPLPAPPPPLSEIKVQLNSIDFSDRKIQAHRSYIRIYI